MRSSKRGQHYLKTLLAFRNERRHYFGFLWLFPSDFVQFLIETFIDLCCFISFLRHFIIVLFSFKDLSINNSNNNDCYLGNILLNIKFNILSNSKTVKLISMPLSNNSIFVPCHPSNALSFKATEKRKTIFFFFFLYILSS